MGKSLSITNNMKVMAVRGRQRLGNVSFILSTRESWGGNNSIPILTACTDSTSDSKKIEESARRNVKFPHSAIKLICGTILWIHQGGVSMSKSGTGLMFALLGVVVTVGFSSAQEVVYYPPVVTYYAPAPAVSYYAPAPTVTYYAPAPAVSYYAPAPTVTYYAPAPAVAYVAPAPAVSTTTYYGPFGRPRAVRYSYYLP
jgi:hypothetical protein